MQQLNLPVYKRQRQPLNLSLLQYRTEGKERGFKKNKKILKRGKIISKCLVAITRSCSFSALSALGFYRLIQRTLFGWNLFSMVHSSLSWKQEQIQPGGGTWGVWILHSVLAVFPNKMVQFWPIWYLPEGRKSSLQRRHFTWAFSFTLDGKYTTLLRKNVVSKLIIFLLKFLKQECPVLHVFSHVYKHSTSVLS